MALIKCKECGKEISEDAEFCPHCGKKIKKSNLFLQIVGILFVLALIGNLSNSNETSSNRYSNSEKTVENIVYQKISLKDLERKLKENAARAQQQYQGMYVEFDGPIDNIDANGEYFSIKSGTFLSLFQCYIKNERQKQVLISKNVGNVVHVKGKIKRVGEIMGYSIDIIELK
jgi:intein/homing endonuclease